MDSDKPFKTLHEQAQIILERGCVGDVAKIESTLAEINYYRLSGYWFPFRQVAKNNGMSDKFIAGVSFDEILSVYHFDQKLRNLVAFAIDKFENKLRMQVAYQWALAKRNETNSPQDELFKKEALTFTSRHIAETYENLREREDFLRHYFKDRHHRDAKTLPIWVLVEFIYFSDLKKILEFLEPPVQQAIANTFGVKDIPLFLSIVALIRDLRNVCAHHLRFWNRIWQTQTRKNRVFSTPILKMPKQANYPKNCTFNRKTKSWKFDENSRVFSFDSSKTGLALAVLSMVLRDSSWTTQLVALLDTQKFPHLNFEKQIGLHPQWKSHPCFKI